MRSRPTCGIDASSSGIVARLNDLSPHDLRTAAAPLPRELTVARRKKPAGGPARKAPGEKPAPPAGGVLNRRAVRLAERAASGWTTSASTSSA